MTRVLCVGDRFITSDALSSAAAETMGPGTDCSIVQTDWPDESFRSVDGVREASGDPAVVASLAEDAEVVLTHLGPITAEVIDAASGLKVIGVTRGGPVNVDLSAATRSGVPVVYLPGRNLDAVAEFTLGLMLALPRSVMPASRALARGVWDASYFRYERTGPELRVSTVGIIGAGAVGRRVADLVAAFGARVLIHDPFADPEPLRAAGFDPVDLDHLLGESDFVSVHARLTDNTRSMFDGATFASMKRGAYFVNTARGELVDEKALLAALDEGHLGGAALDVFHPEPAEPGNPLLHRRNVIATPHLAGASRQVATESARRVATEVATFLRTSVLEHCANPRWSENARAIR